MTNHLKSSMPEDVMLTKKQINVLRSASRKCGMSYRSVCNRNMQEVAKELVKMELLNLHDNGRELGRFVYHTTFKGEEYLK